MIPLSHVRRAASHRFGRLKPALAALTVLEAHGTRRRLGPVEREFRRVDGIRA